MHVRPRPSGTDRLSASHTPLAFRYRLFFAKLGIELEASLPYFNLLASCRAKYVISSVVSSGTDRYMYIMFSQT